MESKSRDSLVPGSCESRTGYIYSEKFCFWNHGGIFTGHEPSRLDGVCVLRLPCHSKHSGS